MWFLYNIEILRALRIKGSYAFLKCPLGMEGAESSAAMEVSWFSMKKIFNSSWTKTMLLGIY